MRRVLASAAVLVAVAAFMVLTLGSGGGSSDPTYRIELDDAFGLISGATFKVAGVNAGSIDSVQLCGEVKHSGCQNPLHALVTVSVTQDGFGAFRSDAFCQSRPQSLIGEYYIECSPGQNGQPLKSGATIPVTHTESTIPIDLLNDVMRLPYRERLTLIINELGAAVAGRSSDLQAALARAVPALDETDNLLNLLANDSKTINALNVSADEVFTALANNSTQVQRFIDMADRAASDSATQQSNIAATWHNLPAFLAQLRPAMAQLGAAATSNLPVVQNLNTASGNLARLFTDLPGFSHASIPAIRALGKASVTGKVAAQAATPTINALNQFAKPTPELGQNLAIVLHDLDDRSRAVEADSRSPGGKGYTGLEALLQYVFNQALAINTFNPLGHVLAVDAFVDPICSPYQNPQTLANDLATDGPQTRRCYSWLGPNQPGINETDPSRPSACVPDPGGAPPGEKGPKTTACKLAAGGNAGPYPTTSTAAASTPTPASTTTTSSQSPPPTGSSSGSSPPSRATSPTGSLGGILGGVAGILGARPSAPSTLTQSSPNLGGATASNAQRLLNYLLAP